MTEWERDKFLRELDNAQSIDDVKCVVASLIQSLPTETIVEKRAREKGWEPYKPENDPVIRKLNKAFDDLMRRL
jgi:hypothetical protein